LVSAHYGNWELVGVALAKMGVPLVSIARPLDDRRLDRLVTQLRSCTGARVLPKRNAFRPALRALREGCALAILADQNTLPPEAVFVPYFDRLAATTPAVAQFHLRSGAPILPVFGMPSGDHYRLAIDPPIETPASTHAEPVLKITTSITARIEHYVRACPEAWLWMHDRWRERPA
ncbi:MAG TPA: lysophospholipid acyltransferase family protein, partial [Acidobacteriota bacterium]|nr:lysophospholipid acyltransferase family protein [Acidobacteriota bacterium]